MTTHSTAARADDSAFTTNTTRRALLGAIAATPLLAASCEPAAAFTCAPSADRADWGAKMAALVEIKDRCAALAREYDRVDAVREAGEPCSAHIDWGAFPPFVDRDYTLRVAQLANPFNNERVAQANQQIVEWRAALIANDENSGWSRITDEWDAAVEGVDEAESALLATPAPDLEALAWKLEHLLDTGGSVDPHSTASWSADYIGTTMADVRRLLRGA